MGKKKKPSSKKIQEKKSGAIALLGHSKEKLLAAALEVFSRHGYHGTTTKMISQAAGVNEALITRHFTSKQGLFFAVVERNVLQLEEGLPYPPQENLTQELRAYADTIFDRDQKNIDFLRILLGQAIQDDDFAREMREQITPPTSAALGSRLKLLQQKNKLPAKLDIEGIEHAVKNQIFSAVLFSGLCCMMDQKEAREDMHFAIGILAKGIEAGK